MAPNSSQVEDKHWEHLIHTGIGEGEDWDNYYTSINSGWSIHLKSQNWHVG